MTLCWYQCAKATRIFALICWLLAGSLISLAQTNYRTNGTGGGSWNNAGTWEIFNGSSWVSASSSPTSADGSIQIRANDVVNVTASVSINETTIDANGTLRLVAGTLSTAAASDLVVDGTFEFARNGGTSVPQATWNTGSLCYITGVTSAAITTTNGGLAPASGFYNFTWNCTAQTINVSLPVNTVHGDFSVLASAGKTITLNSGTSALNVDGNITINNSGATLATGAIAISANSFTLTAGSFTAPSTSVTLAGDLSIDGTYTNNTGSLVFAGSSSQSILGANASTTNFNSITINGSATLVSPTILNVRGSFTNNGSFNAGTNLVNFSGANVQTLSGATNTQFYDLTVNKNGGSLSVNTSETVTNSLTLTAGSLAINSSNLSLANGSTLTRTAGTIATSSPSGGPWNLVYSGATKTTGLEIPTSGNLTSLTVNVNSAATVTLLAGQDISMPGALTISASGRTFTSGANNLTVGSLSNAGTFKAPTSAATVGLTLNGDLTNTGTFTHNSGTVIVNAPLTFSGTTPTLANFQITASGVFTAPSSLIVQGNFANDGTFTPGTGTITFSGSTAQAISATGSLQFYDLVINKTGGSTVTLNASATIANSLTLTAGILSNASNSLSLNSGTTIKRSGGSITSFSPTGGPWDLVYLGSSSFTTGFEIPSSGSVNSFSVTGTGTVTLGSSLVIGSGGFTETAGRFTGGANTISTPFVDIQAGTFTQPTASITVTGDVTIDGSFAGNTGTLIFAGASPQVITGANAATTNFASITVNDGASLTPPSVFNVQGNLVNNGSLTLGTGTVNFKGGSSSLSGSSTTNFYDVNIAKAGTLTVSSDAVIANSLTLTSGTLANATGLLSLQSGVTLTRAGGTISGLSPSGGPWDLVYTGASKTTGLEVPAVGTLNSVTVNTSSGTTVTLNKKIVSTGDLTIVNSDNTVTCGSNYVTISSLVNAGTFNAPSNLSAGLTLSSALVNNGTFNANSGTVIFTGVGSVSGTTIPTFKNFTVSATGSFSAQQDITVQGNFRSDGTFSGGSYSVHFTGATAQAVFGTDNSQFNDVEINKTAGTVTVGSTKTITGTLTLTSGNLSITSNLLSMGNGATINVVDGIILSSSPSGGPWNVTYTGTSPVSTGLEIPTSGSLLSLTSTNSSAVTLSGNLSITPGALTLNNSTGSFLSGSNLVSTSSLIITSGSFTAPSTTLTLTSGDLTIDDTFVHNGGTLAFGGTSSQTISGANALTTDFNSITVNNTATFTPPSALKILSALQNDGTFSPGTGTVTFSDASSSTTAQITGSSKIIFYNITVADGSAGTDLILENTAGADLRNVLNIGSSTFDADGASDNRVFTLLSTSDKPTADASIGPILSGGAVTGNVTVQRYMARSGVSQYQYQVWRDISAPVNSDVADLQNSIPVTGPFTGSSAVSGADYTVWSLLKYADPTADNDGSGQINTNDGYVGFPTNDNTEQFVKGVGYTAFIFGTDSELITPGSVQWSLRGPIHSDPGTTFNLPVVYIPVSGKSAGNTGWNLVGNPYPSTIDWTKLSRVNIGNAIYIDDYSTSTPAFASYVNGVSTHGGSKNIAMGQSFWVKASAASPSLTISENAKVAGTQTSFFRQASPKNLIRVTLASAVALQEKDETVIYFPDLATDGFDDKFDALKLNNRGGYMNLASLAPDQERYAINALSLSSCTKIVGLDISNVSSGSYTLSFTQFQSFPSMYGIQLKDNFIGSVVDVRQAPSYHFSVDTKNEMTFGSGRFSLLFSANGTALNGSVINMDPAQINVIDAQTLQSNYSTGNQWYFDGSPINGATGKTLNITKSGEYMLVVTSHGCSVSTSKAMVISDDNLISTVKVFPNPTKERITIVAPGEEEASGEMYNSIGVFMSPLNFNSDGSSQKATFQFTNESAGIYFVRVNQSNKVYFVRIVKD